MRHYDLRSHQPSPPRACWRDLFRLTVVSDAEIGQPSPAQEETLYILRFRLLLVLCGLTVGGCFENSTSPTVRHVVEQIDVCHGYSCRYRSKLSLTWADYQRLASILAKGRSSPEGERATIGHAVSYFETRTLSATGIRDKARSRFGESGVRGQMEIVSPVVV